MAKPKSDRPVEVGDIIHVRDDHKRGPAPEWVAAIVTDLHESRGGSLRDVDLTVFVVTRFYPIGPVPRPEQRLYFNDHGTGWR
jgi:hypothetical protein